MQHDRQTEASSGRKDQLSLGFSSLYASVGDHIGHFYQTREEWKNVLIPYLKTGLEAREKCLYFMSSGDGREEIAAALAATGIDVEHALSSGRLVLLEGKSDLKELQDLLHSVFAEVPGRFPLVRWGGDMTWSLKKLPTSEMLMEWECHCNTVENPPAVFLCQYELKAFVGSVIMDALKTHPLCIVSNLIHQNPYYENPEALLKELRRTAFH